MSAPSKTIGFMSLSAELRNKVYELAVYKIERDRWRPRDDIFTLKPNTAQPYGDQFFKSKAALIAVSKQINQEYYSVLRYHALHTPDVEIQADVMDFDFRSIMSFINCCTEDEKGALTANLDCISVLLQLHRRRAKSDLRLLILLWVDFIGDAHLTVEYESKAYYRHSPLAQVQLRVQKDLNNLRNDRTIEAGLEELRKIWSVVYIHAHRQMY